jgi:histidyl-tRNA synthetase
MKLRSVKGFRDLLPEQAERRRAIVEACRQVLVSYGFGEVELPMMERVELFSRSVGATSDIVEKEMYAFEDRDGTMVALRPEGTASLVRAYLEQGLANAMPIARLWYTGPMFRRERPQKGRFRQFSQIGAEYLGREDPAADAETLCLVDDICRAVGLREPRIELNSLGDAACRPAYREALTAYGRAHAAELCADCNDRLERNPLRILDCKNEGCRAATAEAPMMVDHLCDACRDHHAEVLRLLDAAGVQTHAAPRMVRGLDYYCRTAFEITAGGLGSQDAVGGGGRYDGLVSMLGGPDTAGIGFAFGIDRLEMAQAAPPAFDESPELLLAAMGEEAAGPALALARRLRAAGARVEVESPRRESELASGRATVRDMRGSGDHPGLFGLGDSAEEILAAVRALAPAASPSQESGT